MVNRWLLFSDKFYVERIFTKKNKQPNTTTKYSKQEEEKLDDMFTENNVMKTCMK